MVVRTGRRSFRVTAMIQRKMVRIMSDEEEEKEPMHVTVDYTSLSCAKLGGDAKTCMDINEPHKRCAWYYECHRHEYELEDEGSTNPFDEMVPEKTMSDEIMAAEKSMRFGPVRCANCG